MRIPFLLSLLASFTFAACTNEDATVTGAPAQPAEEPAPARPAPATEAAVPDSGAVHLHSLAGSGLKFHGVYDMANGNIHYFMRFFERGNVALVAGRQEPEDPNDLRTLLTEDVQSGTNNIHNVPVTRQGDSLHFATMANRGAITYAGVVDGDTLRFVKYSKATGKRGVVNYVYIPDGTSPH